MQKLINDKKAKSSKIKELGDKNNRTNKYLHREGDKQTNKV